MSARRAELEKMKSSRLIILSIVLVAITWTIFAQTVHHQFVNYDDPLYVLENAHVRAGLTWRGIAWAFTHVHSQNWHPLTTMSHMLDCQLFGVNPGPQHLVNVFWHSVAAVLLFIFLQQTSGSAWRSGRTCARSSIITGNVFRIRAESDQARVALLCPVLSILAILIPPLS